MAREQLGAQVLDRRIVPLAGMRQLDRLLEHDATGARRQEHHPIGQRQRFLEIVRHEQDGWPAPAPQRVQPAAKAPRERLVERGERLVHQQQRRLHAERPGERHPTLHAAR